MSRVGPVVGTPPVVQKKPIQAPVSTSSSKARPIASRVSIQRMSFRRVGDDWQDYFSPLLLKSEETRNPNIPQEFWNKANIPSRTAGPDDNNYIVLDFAHVERNKPVAVRHTLHEIDKLQETGDIKAYNGSLKWTLSYFGPEKERTAFFSSPFPRAMFHANEKEVYPIHFLDLHFSMATPFQTHKQLVDQFYHAWNEKGEITLGINVKKELLTALADVIDEKEDYHCLPLHVKLKSVHSTLPVSLQISLQSRLPRSSSRVVQARRYADLKEKERQRAKGYAEEEDGVQTEKTDDKQPLVPDREFPTHTTWANPSSMTSSGTSGFYTVLPFQKSTDDPQGDFLYTAPEATINHPDFSRWIGVNFQQLRDEFDAFREDENYYRMSGESADKVIFTALPFWFFIEFYPLLKSIASESNPPLPPEPRCFAFDNSTGTPWVRIPAMAVEEVIQRLERLYDQDSLLMSLENLSLVIRPENGVKAWEEYTEFVNNPSKGMIAAFDNLAQFDVKLELAYEPFKLDKPKKTASPLSAPFLNHGAVASVSTSASFAKQQQPDLKSFKPEDWAEFSRLANSGGGKVGVTIDQIKSLFEQKRNGSI